METVVIYPAAGLSHLIPAVELAKQLLSHSHSRTSVTFFLASLPSIDTSLTSYISSVSAAFPSISFHYLPPVPLSKPFSEYPDVESILFENLRNNNPNVLNALNSISLASSISVVIIDFFCYSSIEVSRSLDIPSYFFFPPSASTVSLFLNFPSFDRTNTGSFRNLDVSLEIPGLFSFPSSHLLEPMLDRGVSCAEFVRVGEALAKSDGLIINTFDALEVKAVEGLKHGYCLPGTTVPPVYCIGPLIASKADNINNECLNWLDSQPRKSVVYLSFGSHGRFSKEQLKEIAIGLERSMVRFLWVVRDPTTRGNASEIDLESLLPERFLDRTKERGIVVKSWAPQIAVLGHESVGGFVTHCGWNSILEAVLFGVPMVAWPLYAEQRFNKIVVVQELRIALPMDESADRFVSSNEVERRIKQLLDSEDGNVLRKRILDFKEEAQAALNHGGSSSAALARLVESWKR